jgi:hypothetical protein
MKVVLPLAVLVLLACPQQHADGSRFELSVVDEQGAALPCRVLLRPSGGECVVPEGAVELAIGPDRWFMSPGRTVVNVPAGLLGVRVEHGLEFQRYKGDVHVGSEPTLQQVTLPRWVNMRERGYLCGENHVHLDTPSVAKMLICEGLDFGSSLTWFNGPDQRRPIPPGKGSIRLLRFAGRAVPSSIYDAELEYRWGAAYIQQLPEPLPLRSERGRPNLDYLKHAVAAGGIVHYQAGWSREVALDALLGYVHTVNVCNNNFHLHRYQQRSHYSNLLNVDGFPLYPNTEEGMLRMNTETYYRLLNWGLQLAAGAGSAVGVKQTPVGYNRAYVRALAGTPLEQFNQAWAAGKNFVTNGPLLFLETADGKRPGDTIGFPVEGGEVRLQLAALSDQDLRRVEIVMNGSVVAEWNPGDDCRELALETKLPIREGAWIAARATAEDRLLTDEELARFAHGTEDDLYRIRPSRLRFAHTSPIYVRVGGQLAGIEQSIDEGLRMLDRFALFAREHAGPQYLPGITLALAKAREKLESRRGAGRRQ